MPTGYTNDLYEGKQQSFEQFVMHCARAMGACVLMRDDPSDAPIPERFEPSDHHLKEIAKDSDALGALEAMTPDEVESAAEAAYQKEATWKQGWIEEGNAIKERYERMLKLVRRWAPPTPDHEGFKRFMIEQLELSIEGDCRRGEVPPKPAAEDWRRLRIAELRRSLEYHKKEHAVELERTEGRNAWIKALRDSVPQP